VDLGDVEGALPWPGKYPADLHESILIPVAVCVASARPQKVWPKKTTNYRVLLKEDTIMSSDEQDCVAVMLCAMTVQWAIF
jgi:hypothetical protein